MNRIPKKEMFYLLTLLSEGNGIRTLERTFHIHRDTIIRNMVYAGKKAREVHNHYIKNLSLYHPQVDEMWTFIFKKKENIKPSDRVDPRFGDAYLYHAIDEETKLIVAYVIGKRCWQSAEKIMMELARRVPTIGKLSTDAYKPFIHAAKYAYGSKINFGQIKKTQGKVVRVRQIFGDGSADKHYITSHIERYNKKVRMHVRRYTRRVDGFSKKPENLQAHTDLLVFYCNFMLVHWSLGTTPAVYAGITDHIWSWEELVGFQSMN